MIVWIIKTNIVFTKSESIFFDLIITLQGHEASFTWLHITKSLDITQVTRKNYLCIVYSLLTDPVLEGILPNL